MAIKQEYLIHVYTDVGYDQPNQFQQQKRQHQQMLNRDQRSLPRRHLRDWQSQLQHRLQHRTKILFKKTKYHLHLHH